ncbi:hypothetical protein RUND412_008179 [Rhizina undulata]
MPLPSLHHSPHQNENTPTASLIHASQAITGIAVPTSAQVPSQPAPPERQLPPSLQLGIPSNTPERDLPPQPPRKTLSFRLSSPIRPGNDVYASPTELRPGDPTAASYTAYHATTGSGSGGSGSRESSMHRTNTGVLSSSKYSPNLNIATNSNSNNNQNLAADARKYTHPGALTPTYPSSSQNSGSHASGAAAVAAHLGMPFAGLSGGNSREREELIGGVGAVGNGRWMSPWGLYAVDWCKWPVPAGQGYGRVAVGSYAEDSHNYIQILDTRPSVPEPGNTGSPPPSPSLEFTKIAEASHTYPITRILWEPPTANKPLTDLLATSGDHLRLWSLPSSSSASSSASATPSNSITSRPYHPTSQKLTPLALLSNSKSTDFTAPLTSLDWNPLSPSLIITSSIDTTCTIWDIPTLTAKTQLIAHDKEVFDVRFMSGSVDIFASCGADGSVRMFDLRSLEHSTIIYEPGVMKSEKEDGGSPVNSPAPLLRLAASPHDSHLIATFSLDSHIVRILDVRQPGQALIELKGHSNNVNCIEWNPSRRGIIAAGGDDSLVLIWDLMGSNGSHVSGDRQPVATWRCDYEVNNCSWSPGGGGGGEYLGVVGGRGVWGVKV